MKLYEYQAKARFRAAGVPLLSGRLCTTAVEAAAAAEAIGGPVVVKAQVLVGGRGKAGGIRMAASPAEAAAHAADLLACPLLGHKVSRVLVEPRAKVDQELYLGCVLDAPARQTLFLLGPGGVDVEARPEAIWRAPIDPVLGVPLFVLRDGLLALGLPQSLAQPLHAVATALVTAFRENSATLAEINPLALGADGLTALDARLVVDDSAIERVPEIARYVSEGPDEFPEEHLKLTLGFDYVEVDPEGDVGLLSSGAGLTMTVMDLIRRQGGRPINFVDLRTGSVGRDPTRITWVLDRLGRVPSFRSVLVNVFAGITNLEDFAHALVAALEGYPSLRGRVIVRASGTGFAGAKVVWERAALPVVEDLEVAVGQAVLAARA